jgi:hypothetical protein
VHELDPGGRIHADEAGFFGCDERRSIDQGEIGTREGGGPKQRRASRSGQRRNPARDECPKLLGHG